jgi:hypothetical protein
MEACRLKMEPWKVCIPVVANSHHLDEEQDPTDPRLSEKSDPDSHEREKWIRVRIRIEVKRIQNPGYNSPNINALSPS